MPDLCNENGATLQGPTATATAEEKAAYLTLLQSPAVQGDVSCYMGAVLGDASACA